VLKGFEEKEKGKYRGEEMWPFFAQKKVDVSFLI